MLNEDYGVPDWLCALPYVQQIMASARWRPPCFYCGEREYDGALPLQHALLDGRLVCPERMEVPVSTTTCDCVGHFHATKAIDYLGGTTRACVIEGCACKAWPGARRPGELLSEDPRLVARPLHPVDRAPRDSGLGVDGLFDLTGVGKEDLRKLPEFARCLMVERIRGMLAAKRPPESEQLQAARLACHDLREGNKALEQELRCERQRHALTDLQLQNTRREVAAVLEERHERARRAWQESLAQRDSEVAALKCKQEAVRQIGFKDGFASCEGRARAAAEKVRPLIYPSRSKLLSRAEVALLAALGVVFAESAVAFWHYLLLP